jgi:hypothetical protein
VSYFVSFLSLPGLGSLHYNTENSDGDGIDGEAGLCENRNTLDHLYISLMIGEESSSLLVAIPVRRRTEGQISLPIQLHTTKRWKDLLKHGRCETISRPFNSMFCSHRVSVSCEDVTRTYRKSVYVYV